MKKKCISKHKEVKGADFSSPISYCYSVTALPRPVVVGEML